MTITPPPPNQASYSQPQKPSLPRRSGWIILLGVVVTLGMLVVGYWWFVQRVEVPREHVLVLMRKVGTPLPAEAAGQVVLYPELLAELNEPADSHKYRGILYDVKTEGRYFFDPFFWKRETVPAEFVQQDELGVLIRKYGKPLPPGKVVATEPDERGPLAEVLRQGRHNINPYAYELRRFKPVRIPEGSVGVQTLYSGDAPENPNVYVVESGERGVQPNVLPPGLYYKNPYVWQTDIIDVRSHTIDLRDEDAIRFPSKDSFNIVIEGTVEYAIRQADAPYVLAAIGDHEDIKAKLILPYMRSFARIEGSKLEAREFITGDTRRAFQDQVFEGLRQQCSAQGIEIRAALIRRIEPPAAIANPISQRQVAVQQINQYENEIKLAESQARLVEQEEMQRQNQELGQAEREVVTLTMEAQQDKAVALTEASKRLEVAKLELEAARENAAAMLSHGEADAEVIRLTYTAEAEPLADAVRAFGDGETYAQYFFYQKLSPAVKSVLASTEGPLADIFRSLGAARPAVVPAQGTDGK